MSNLKLLFTNGLVSQPSDSPPVTTLLENYPGAYTTSRTHNNGLLLLFWERHLSRLANSARILFDSNPELLFKPGKSRFPFPLQFHVLESAIKSRVNDSMRNALPVALKERKNGEELAITTLVSGNLENLIENESGDVKRILECFNVYVHVGTCVPLLFGIRDNGAHLAAVGPGRDFASAKYSDWVRLRKSLEKLRPPSATELLLSNDGDQILEGCLTNFFVVCRKDGPEDFRDTEKDAYGYKSYVEIQTAPISDGVLPGIVRQVIIEVCLKYGIPLREVPPSWSARERWEEAFITNSLRLLQHVETVRVPLSWESLESKTWKEVTWEEKKFEECPGSITSIIQKGIMEKAIQEGYPVTSVNG